jgi:transposase
MKLQDVVLKTIAKKWSYYDAAEIAGIGVSRLAQIIEDYRRLGYTGIVQYRSGRIVRHRLPLHDLERILALFPVQAKLSLASFRRLLAHEGIKVEHDWLQAALAGAGMIPTALPRSKRTPGMGRVARENRLAFPDFYPKVSTSKTVSRRTA